MRVTLPKQTTWAITADSITYGWETTCTNKFIYAKKKGREAIVYQWRFYQENTPATPWINTIEPKLNVNFVPANNTYTVALITQNGCGYSGLYTKNITFTPFNCRMAEERDEGLEKITATILLPQNANSEWVRIIDMGGKVVLEGNYPLESDWQQIFIYELDMPSGIYIIQQLKENKIINTKIFKP